MQQMGLFPSTKRARRKGARRPGRKPKVGRIGFVPHVARAIHERRHPVHVSIRRVRLAPSFRSQRVFAAIFGQISAAKRRGVRVLHYSIQENHIHLMVEAADNADLANQMRTLFSGIAMSVNGVARRSGSLFRDRHHRHELRTPTETRNTLVYILFNSRKHETAEGVIPFLHEWLDEYSSAAWFDDWDPAARPSRELLARRRAEHADSDIPISTPTTWLAQTGWRRAGGPIRFDEMPRRGH